MYPQNATWEDWNGDLLHYFSEEPLPMVREDHWQDLAAAMGAMPTFDNYAIPDPSRFDTWQEWVLELITAVNGPTI
jgi:hypothetical protein